MVKLLEVGDAGPSSVAAGSRRHQWAAVSTEAAVFASVGPLLGPDAPVSSVPRPAVPAGSVINSRSKFSTPKTSIKLLRAWGDGLRFPFNSIERWPGENPYRRAISF